MAYTDNNGLTPVVKLRLGVVGAVIGGPPVADEAKRRTGRNRENYERQ